MSENLSEILVVVPMALAVATATLAFVRAPRWYGVSMSRHKMWRLHDSIVDSIYRQELPNLPVSWELADEVVDMIERAGSLTFLRYKLVQHLGSLTKEPLRPKLKGLKGPQRRAYLDYACRLGALQYRHRLVSSWAGLTYACLRPSLWEVLMDSGSPIRQLVTVQRAERRRQERAARRRRPVAPLSQEVKPRAKREPEMWPPVFAEVPTLQTVGGQLAHRFGLPSSRDHHRVPVG